MIPRVRVESENPDLLVGLALVEGVEPGPARPDLAESIALVSARRAEGHVPPDELRTGIRDLLRRGGYKPTGRGKPASEYLVRAAQEGRFPSVNNLVDAANRYSLLTGLPISLLDADLALAGCDGLVVREGRAGERYVFNAAGHEIDVEGLVSICREGGPVLGNAVKDSMATKTHDGTRRVLAVVWASRRVVPADVLSRMAEQLAGSIAQHAGGTVAAAWVLPEESESG